MSVIATESPACQHLRKSLCRWDIEPFRLWSLLEMLRFHAVSFAAAIGALERSAGQLAITEIIGAPTYERISREKLREALHDLQEELKELPVSVTITEQISRAAKRVDDDNPDVLITLLREIHNNVLTELSSYWFLAIRSGRHRELYEQKRFPFGDVIADKYPDSKRDVSAAARCIALDEWTAAVFHLMRVLEHGLRPMATRFNVPFAQDSWHKVIDGIETGIDGLRNPQNRKLTDDERKEITFYSEAASQFRYFKDAWRNHVSHARTFYDEREALSVWNHVREFMDVLARGPR